MTKINPSDYLSVKDEALIISSIVDGTISRNVGKEIYQYFVWWNRWSKDPENSESMRDFIAFCLKSNIFRDEGLKLLELVEKAVNND